MSSPTAPTLIGDAAYRRRTRARRLRSALVQLAFMLALLVLLAWLAVNVAGNLQLRQIRAGFQFLLAPAGFNIGESLLPFSPADNYVRAFGVGLLNTLRVAVAAIIGATFLGVVVGLARLSQHPLVRSAAGLWVQLSRNIPLLILLLALYLVLTELFPDVTEPWQIGQVLWFSKQGLQVSAPQQLPAALGGGLLLVVLALLVQRGLRQRRASAPSLLHTSVALLLSLLAGLVLAWLGGGWLGGWSHPELDGLAISGGAALSPEFMALLVGLSFFTSGSIAEIVRAGAQAVPQGQWRAGQALGLTRGQTISAIVFPQALRLALPPLASQYMNLIKNSSLAVVIGYPDVVSVANTTINQNGQALECIILIMAVYLAINLLVAFWMNFFNARVTRASH